MTAFVEVRGGTPFRLDGQEYLPARHPGSGSDLELKTAGNRHPDYICFGEFLSSDWEVMRPYPTSLFSDEIDTSLAAVLVKRSKRYRSAQRARDFIRAKDLHEDGGPIGLRALFRSMGGIVIQPGGLSDRDAESFPGRSARLHGSGDITLFQQDGEDEVRRRELMALTIAVQELQWEHYEGGYAHGPLDVSLGDARRDHLEAHLFAAMLLVPQADAAGGVDIATAEEIGAELKVDPCTVQDAHQLWDEITHPELPKA